LFILMLIVVMVMRVSTMDSIVNLAGLVNDDRTPHPVVTFILATAIFVTNQILAWWIPSQAVVPALSGFFLALFWLRLPIPGHVETTDPSTDTKHLLALITLLDEIAIYMMAGILSQYLSQHVLNHRSFWETLGLLFIFVPLLMALLGNLWEMLKGPNLFRSAGAVVIVVAFTRQHLVPASFWALVALVAFWILVLSLLSLVEKWAPKHVSRAEKWILLQSTALFRALLTAFVVQVLTDRLNTRFLNQNPTDVELVLFQIGIFFLGMVMAWYFFMSHQVSISCNQRKKIVIHKRE